MSVRSLSTCFTKILFVLSLSLAGACADPVEPPEGTPTEPPATASTPTPELAGAGLTAIPAYVQRPGDPAAGWDFLIYGNYSGTGFPAEVWADISSPNEENILGREGDNATLGPAFVAFDTENGTRVVGNTCLGCHMARLGEKDIIGLGDSFTSFTYDLSAGMDALRLSVARTFGAESPEYEAFDLYATGWNVVGPYAITPFSGVNPAFMVEEAAAGYRDPLTLSWREAPVYDISPVTLASDTPPWWHVKKKNAWYYNGMGRGDHARLAMQISVIGLVDAHQAEDVDGGMEDLVAYLRTLEAPAWPFALDAGLATEGAGIFAATCSRCHGTYGEVETYPNLLVDVEVVGTDRAYADYFVDNEGLKNWFNEGWYGRDGLSFLAPERAYVAPPLDGIWASAPYLHNGSVPTLYALLKSAARPTQWLRDFEAQTYDPQAVGWAWEDADPEANEDVYDTTLFGYGNGGHTFGDALSDAERWALIEYLKTL